MKAAPLLISVFAATLTAPWVIARSPEVGTPNTAQPQAAPAPQSAPSLAPLPAAPGTPAPQTTQPQWDSLFDEAETGILNENHSLNAVTPAPNAAPQDPWGFRNDPFFQRGFGAQRHQVVDPWAILHEQMQEMDRMHQHMMQQFHQGGGTSNLPANVQAFNFSTSGGDIEDKGDHYEIALQMSGLDQGSTNLEVEGNQLVLNCVQQQQVTQADPNGQGRAAASFTNNIQRRWTLPVDADRTGVQADFETDRLLITVPKVANAQQSIPVPIK